MKGLLKKYFDCRLQKFAMKLSELLMTFCLFCILTCVIAQEKKEEWGYVTVRPGAHMFWWLYRSPLDWQDKPLVMWLQVRMRDVLVGDLCLLTCALHREALEPLQPVLEIL